MDEQKQEKPRQGATISDIHEFRNMLPPANPIISKQIQQTGQKVSFRLDSLKVPNQQESRNNGNSKEPLKKEEVSRKANIKERREMDKMTLTNGYDPSSMQFVKFDNHRYNRRGNIQYFASLFVPFDARHAPKLPEYKGKIFDDQLQFDSDFQSGNLFAVFKVDTNTYDLVLQNDMNTRGFTQWFNFKVHNKRNNFIAKFNIVNLYKAKSLYQKGMKPIVRSEKSQKNGKKSWRRRGFNIYYQRNDLNYEDDDKKLYKTLSFQYDFTIDKDVVQFAHALPYDLNDLKKLIESIKDNSKVGITSIGSTIMGRSIPMITISAENPNRIPKKALVILGRQHPGQTPGSFIGEQMTLEFLKNNKEIQFILWRYDIYIFPMVNIDGVALGNYRGNFAGYDLNRCWLRPDANKQPQAFLIKNMIRKISKKQPIELIVDLHGHSRRMGSFFYGNDYGQNHMLFPYIASKMNRSILFEKSKFSHETENDAKFSTARVVLGNIVKDAGGYVYTYEVSFFGYFKENTEVPFAFTEDHYKQLGKALVQSIYRTYLQIYKEQKTLKESAFLKTVKHEIMVISGEEPQEDSQSGSDSEAKEEMKEQINAIQQFLSQNQLNNNPGFGSVSIEKKRQKNKTHKSKSGANYQQINQSKERSISKNSAPASSKQFKEIGLPVQRYNQQIKKKIEDLIDKNIQNDLKSVIAERLPALADKNSHLKSEKSLQESGNGHLYPSSLVHRNAQMAYLDYLKKKKQQRECESSLHIYGANFEIVPGRKEVKSPPSHMKTLSGQPESKTPQQDLKKNSSYTIEHKRERSGSDKSSGPNKASKSYHTIDMNGYISMSRQEQDLINHKPYFQRRKINSNHYLMKQEGTQEMESLENISKNSFKVQRINVNTPQNRSQEIPPALTPSIPGKKRGTVKLPLI